MATADRRRAGEHRVCCCPGSAWWRSSPRRPRYGWRAYFIYRRNAYQVFPLLHVQAVALPPVAAARGHRLQHLRAGHRLGEQAELRARRNHHWRLSRRRIQSRCGRSPTASSPRRSVSRTRCNAVLFPLVVDSDTRRTRNAFNRMLVGDAAFARDRASRSPRSSSSRRAAGPRLGRDKAGRCWVAAPVIQILAFAVALRWRTPRHDPPERNRRAPHLAMVNLGTGLANLALSAALIDAFGLVGVAVGTLIPIAFCGALHHLPGRLPARGCRPRTLLRAASASRVAGRRRRRRHVGLRASLSRDCHAGAAQRDSARRLSRAVRRSHRPPRIGLYVRRLVQLIAVGSAVPPKAPLTGAVLGGQ